MTVIPFEDPEDWWIAQLSNSAMGIRALQTFFASQRWIHRRVERVSFSDGRAYSRRVSLDVSVPVHCPSVISPSGDRYSLLPVSLLRKVPLVDFSLEGDLAKTLFNLTLEQNAALSFAGLRTLAAAAAAQPLSNELSLDIRSLVEGPAIAALSARERILSPDLRALDIAQRKLVKDGGITEWFLGQLAENFLFVIPVQAPVGSRLVVKYSHSGWDEDDPSTHDPWYLKFVEGLGLRATHFYLNATSASTAGSYHLQVDLPKGVVEKSVKLLALQEDKVAEIQTRRAPGRTPHLVCSRLPLAQSVKAEVQLQPSPIHWLVQSSLASAASAILLGLFWWRTDAALSSSGGAGTGQTVVTALLLASSSLIATLLTRPGEHGLASRLVRKLRLVAGTVLGAPFVASLLVALAFPKPAIHTVMFYLAVYSAVGLALLCIALWMSLRCDRVLRRREREPS